MMKRSGFARPAYSRATVPLTPASGRGIIRAVDGEVRAAPKGVTAKPGKRAPNEVEREWMDAIVRFGCVACWMDGNQPRPTAVHHILRGGRRIGHLYSLPLCDTPQGGHHQNGAAIGLISRHPYKARFEHRYGTELELLAMLKTKLGFFDKYEVQA